LMGMSFIACQHILLANFLFIVYLKFPNVERQATLLVFVL